MNNVLNALDAMLEAYRKKEREFPSYDELAGLLKAPAILVSADPAENEAIARDAQAIVAAGVAALGAGVDWMMCERIACEDHVDEALRVFTEDATQDNATGLIQAALTVYLADTAAAAPQVVADERRVIDCAKCEGHGATHYPDGEWEGKCATCNGTGVVSDGEINAYPDGSPYLNGPVKCVKDCPDCSTAPVQAQEPVAYLKFWAEQSWSGNGNHDIDYGEGLEVCEAGDIGADKLPAFPVFRAPVQPVAVPEGVAEPTYMTEEQGRDWAWKDVKKDVGTIGWTAGDNGHFFGFFVHGWNYRGQFEKQRAAPAAQGDATQAEIDVRAERRRQINVEGRTADSDDRHIDCELARAAATYALCTEPEQLKLQGVAVWPWNRYWWKFTDYRRNLVKSGALILAEIERLDRAAIAAKAAS